MHPHKFLLNMRQQLLMFLCNFHLNLCKKSKWLLFLYKKSRLPMNSCILIQLSHNLLRSLRIQH